MKVYGFYGMCRAARRDPGAIQNRSFHRSQIVSSLQARRFAADLSNHNHATPVELVMSRFPGGATSPNIPPGCEALLDVRFLIMQFLPFTSALHPQFSNVDS